MLEQIYDNPDDIPYFDEITYDYLLESVYPQEAFYLDENGNTVFFVDPGVVADESLGYVVFPIPPEDIISEF